MAPDASDDPIVRELSAAVTGRYTLERELGRGGMGAVFLARDLRLDRLVAIKVLPPELAVRPELRERFLREIRTAASFSHPNIVSVHGVEEANNLLFFAMAYVEGETLTERIRRQGPLPVPELVRLLQEVAWALSYAHGREVVHRDVKPDNILLERATGRALVMDFGIARSVAASGLTQMGETVGTPHFMSPEQAAGDRVDGRSDLYALGVVGYFAATARLPFEGDSAQAVMVAQISQAPAPVASRRPDLPAPLVAVLERCLAKDPADRFARGEELVEALEQVQARRVEVPPPIRVWTVRADQFFRNGLILGLLMPQALVRFSSERTHLAFTGLIFSVVVPALWLQIPMGMRELAQQGFGFGELRSGIAAIDAEREAVVAAQQADPRFRRRRRRKLLTLVGGLVLSVAVIAMGIWSGTQRGPDQYQVSPPVLVMIGVALCVGMVCLVFLVALLASGGRMDRRLHRMWTGALGQFLFRVGSWRVAGTGGAGVRPTTRHGALTLLATLDRDQRRRLPGAATTLERLEAEVERLDRRERELAGALTEAKVGGPTLPGSAGQRQQQLLDDLERARLEVLDRRTAVLAGLENIRLALVRLKSKLGMPADVEREVAEAERLLSA
jgi:serine/threonine-protein kinase